MIELMIVEDNDNLRKALIDGMNALEELHVLAAYPSGEEALAACHNSPPHAILMDVQLAGELNGIQTAVATRKEFSRLPVVFYSIQDDEKYYRDFQKSGIISHYTYVSKSNYLLPGMILPLIKDAIAGRSYIDPEIEARVQEVRGKDSESPMTLLDPDEIRVAELIAEGCTNEQIARHLGIKDKRTISRMNGQIYSAWGLDTNTTDEKVARTRAALIVLSGRLLTWDDKGKPYYRDEQGIVLRWRKDER
jgi:DNA-binding NarL/FixJ family response regulator